MLGRFRYQSIRNGLVGHWRPSRGPTGNTLIDSVRGNHGSLVVGAGDSVATKWVARGAGYALSFDGVDDFAEVANYPTRMQINSQFSLSFWLATTSASGSVFLSTYNAFNSTSGWVAECQNNAIGFNFINANAQNQMRARGSTAVNDGVLRHVAITHSGNSSNTGLTFYVNGFPEAVTLVTNANPGTLTDTRLWFARWSFGYIQCVLDDISIFNRALAASEVITLYTAGRGALDQRINMPVVRGYDPGASADVFTATAGFSVGATSLAANATFTQPSYTANAALSTRSIVESQATFTQPSYTAEASLSAKASLAASATFTAPTYSANAAISIGSITVTASAIHSSAVYSAEASLTTKSTVQASATFTAPTYSATASLSTKATAEAVASFTAPSFTCTAVLQTGSLSLAAMATFSTVSDATGQYFGSVVVYSQTVVCYRNTVRAH